jgi:hypothetical protein
MWMSLIRNVIMAALSNISVRDLRKAVSLRERIEALERQLASILGGSGAVGSRPGSRRRTISASGRARIAAAQRLRWARLRGGAKAPKKGRRKMSAAARARISAAAKTRWAKVKARGGRTLAA